MTRPPKLYRFIRDIIATLILLFGGATLLSRSPSGNGNEEPHHHHPHQHHPDEVIKETK